MKLKDVFSKVFASGRAQHLVFQCENCGNTEFLEGPHGGEAINFCCARCWTRYNDTIFGIERSPFSDVVDPKSRDLFGGVYEPRQVSISNYRRRRRQK